MAPAHGRCPPTRLPQTVTTERKGQPALAASQRQQVDALHARCIELLRAIPPGGHKFAAAVLAMLEREEHWIRWKANGCQAFDKAAALTRDEGAAGGKKRKLLGGAGGGKKVMLGNSALTRLWNMGGNELGDIASRETMPALKEYLQVRHLPTSPHISPHLPRSPPFSHNSPHLPRAPHISLHLAPSRPISPHLAPSRFPLSTHLQEVYEQSDPEAGIEKEYLKSNDKAFCWKAFRLISKTNVALLAKVSQVGGSLEAAAKHLFESEDGSATKDEAVEKLGE